MKNILIVDDKLENNYLLEKLFQGCGYSTTAASNGRDALSAALANPPDLIVSDILMPIMDGFTFCSECKKSDSLKNIPFVFYTATYTSAKDEEFAMKLGANRFIIKPMDPDEFIAIIDELLTEIRAGEISIPAPAAQAEQSFLKEYNEVLIRKLEDKVAQTEEAHKKLKEYASALEEQIAMKTVAENKARESEAKYRSIFENTGTATCIIEENNIISLANEEFLTLSGCKRQEIEGCKSWLEFVHQDDKSRLMKNHIHRLHNPGSVEKKYEFRFVTKSGVLRYVFLSVDIIPGTTKSVVSLLDITEQKDAAEELMDAKEKAETMNRLKSSFLANMSHELRTPMIGVLGYAELLKTNKEISNAQNWAGIISNCASRLMETLDLILDLSRLEADKLPVGLAPVNVISVIRDIIQIFQPMAKKKDLYLLLDTTSNSFNILTSERMFRQIINNLVNNAIKYTERGGVSINVTSYETAGALWLEIKITDTGIGIAKKDHGIIWDEFRQVSEGLNRGFEGTGLGLTITKRFVEKLCGELMLESELGKGSTFTVRFPVEKSLQPDDESKEKGTEQDNTVRTMPEPMKKNRLLIVEDDKITLDYLKLILSGQYNVDTAQNGSEAIQSAQDARYDLVLLDINLGKGITGLDALKEIRKLDGYTTVPIVAMTAYAMVGDKEHFVEEGCDYYLSKPFSRTSLVEFIGNILTGE